MRRVLTSVLTAVLAGSIFTTAPATAASHDPACAEQAHPGGDWPLYGHDVSNTRSQPSETTIGAAQAAALQKSWSLSASANDGVGAFQSTPIVSGGCVYAATDGGSVFAMNADTGDVVWQKQFDVAETRLGGTITGAVATAGGLAFIHVSDAGRPFVVALDQQTGAEQWRTTISNRPGSFINASPVLFDGMLFTGIAGDEYANDADTVSPPRGGYVILDQQTGQVLADRSTIPDEDFAAGYWGGSIWSTGVYEPGGKHIFVGTGNPSSHDREHQHTNAILKIDADPARESFGRIVDAYKGDVDQYYPGLDRQPVCESQPDLEYGDAWSLSCVQFDIDFGASPNLFHDARGNLLVGGLQKSGIYHAAYASTLQRAWTSVVGTPCFVCSASSSAVAGDSVFAYGTLPGQLVSLNQDGGGYRWAHPVADIFHWQSVSAANGLVYVTDVYGALNIVDASTGLLVAKRDMASDAGTATSGVGSAGVAIARNSIYAAGGDAVIVYKA